MKVQFLLAFLTASSSSSSVPGAAAFGPMATSSASRGRSRRTRTTTAFRAVVEAESSSSVASSSSSSSIVDENPRTFGLALALDDGTRKSHSVAENTAFVQGFFKGISGPDSYRNLLTSLYYVYRAMEVDVMDVVRDLREKEDVEEDEGARWISALDAAPLRRLDGLERDMEYFYGPDWKTTMTPPTANTIAYVNRIRELAASVREDNDNENQNDVKNKNKESLLYLFVAHQYTRYLGDLFGGQMMGNMASRSMDLPGDGSGIRFYTFEDVPSKKGFITEWYATLNDLGVSPEREKAIVDEANLVFQLNIGILEELEGSPWRALWTMALTGWSSVKESKNGGDAS